MATQDDYIRTALRVPPDLHAKIHESAKANNRTFNAEIVARLEESFQPPSSMPAQDAGVLKGVEKSNLETRLMDLWTQRRNENINLMYLEDRLSYLEDDQSEDAKFERHIAEHERTNSMRKLGALDQAIEATFSFANQKGIHLDPEEINQREK